MATRTDQAIVVRLSDYSETSQIVSLFTARGGAVRLIAKGIRRGTRTRFAAGLDLLEYGEASYAPARDAAGLSTLAEWVQRDAFPGLRRGLVLLYGGMYAAELVAALTEEGDPHPTLFDALLALLRTLAGQEPAAQDAVVRALVGFQFELLTAIGYAPNLGQCVDCGRPRARGAAAFFSATAGGLICRDCEMHHVEKRRVRPTLLSACDAQAGIDGGRRSGPPRDWFDLLDYHLTHTAGRPFRLSAPLAKLIAYRTS